ncbi:MAG: FAD-binding oxidoreductase, partial [Candidatus Limnocylindrales bacterium]
MHPVVKREVLSPNVTRLQVEASRVAKVRRPGQFVIVRIGDGAERVPLTIADADAEAGTITLTIQAVGKTSCDLCMLQVGDAIQDVAGPL